MKKLKIIHILPSFEPGGVNRLVDDLIRNYNSNQFEIAVIIMAKTSLSLENELIGVPVQVIHLQQDIHQLFTLKNFLKILKVAINFHPDIIQMHHADLIRLAQRISFLAGIPVRVFTVHGTLFVKTMDAGKEAFFLKKIFNFFPVSISQFMCDEIRMIFKLKEVRLIYNGIDLEKYGSQFTGNGGEPLKLIHVGRFNPEKRHRVLIKAFQRVAEAGNVRLILCGEGETAGYIKEMAKVLKLSSKIDFLGTRNDIPALLADSDIFIFPSDNEPFGLALVEAMAVGLPVIAVKSGAIPEIIKDGVNGILVEPDNPVALAEAIMALAKDPILRETMGRKSRELAKQFDIKKTAQDYQDLYRELYRQRMKNREKRYAQIG